MSNSTAGAAFFVLTLLIATGCSGPTAQEHLERAQEYQQAGDLASAVIEYKNVLQQEPENADGRFGLGSVYLASGSAGDALNQLQRALDLGYPGDQVMPALLQAKLELGRYSEVLGELAEDDELSPDLLTIKGQALLQAGELEAAAASFDAAIAGDANQSLAYLGRARIERATGRRDAAAELIDRGLKLTPDVQKLWLAKAELAVEAGEYPTALDALHRAAELPGSNDVPALALARVLSLSGDVDGAYEVVSERLRRSPQHPAFNLYLGALELQRGNLDAAEAALRIVQSRAPDYAPALFLMGAVKYQQGFYAQAVNQLNRYVSLTGGNPEARKMLAAAQLQNGDAGAAVDALNPIANAMTEDPTGNLLLGQAFLAVGDPERAAPYLVSVANADNTHDAATARMAVAGGFVQQGDFDSAIEELQAAAAVPGHEARVDVMLITMLLRAGRLDDADTASAAFLEREPGNPAAYDIRGDVERARGDTSAARSSYERALEIDGDFVASQAKLAEMAVAEGDLAQATQRYDAIVESHADNLVALMGLAQIALSRDDNATAIDYLNRARSGNPQALPPRVVLGNLAIRTGDAKTATEVADEAIGIAPDDPTVLIIAARAAFISQDKSRLEQYLGRLESVVNSASGEPDVAVQAGLGDLQRRVGQFESAQRNLNEAFDRGDHSLQTSFGLVETSLRTGNRGSARKALEQLKLGGQVGGQQLAMLEGDVLMLEGKAAAAVGKYRGAVDAGNLAAIVPLAGAIERAHGRAAAVDFLDNMVNDNPGYAPAFLKLAELELLSGDYKKAVSAYESFNALEPDRPDVLNNLAWLSLQTGNPNALSYGKRAYELAPKDPNVADTLGWIMVKTGADPQEGVRLLETAARANRGSAGIRYHLAEAYVAVNRPEDGLKTVKEALQLGDFRDRADAQALLKKLESSE
jgi:putative PEP-CTERM system TPR-repeat lipoprotein